MYKIFVLSLCLFWTFYIRTVSTSFISDKALRPTVNCDIQCEDDDFCNWKIPNTSCNDGYCTCDYGRVFNRTCYCIPCSRITECVDLCCDSGVCHNDDCLPLPSPTNGQDILLTATQITMTGALIIGIITIVALLWKMCSKADYRTPITRRTRRLGNAEGSRRSGDSNASVGSLQRDVTARLRDAPPPYIRSPPLPPPGDTPPPYHLLPSQGYVNGCFEGEGNIPPPEYSVAVTLANNTQSTGSNVETQKPENGLEESNNKDNKIPNNVPEASTVHI